MADLRFRFSFQPRWSTAFLCNPVMVDIIGRLSKRLEIEMTEHEFLTYKCEAERAGFLIEDIEVSDCHAFEVPKSGD